MPEDLEEDNPLGVQVTNKINAKKGPPPKYEEESIIQTFLDLNTKLKAVASSFTFRFGKDDDKIDWHILSFEEQIVECPMESFHKSEDATTNQSANPLIKSEIPWDPDITKVDYNVILLEIFFDVA